MNPPHTISRRKALPACMSRPAPRLTLGRAVFAGVDLELLDQPSQLCGRFHQLLRSLLGISGASRRALGSLGYARNIAGDLAAAVRRFTDVARHLVGGRILLFDRRGDGARSIVDLVDDAADGGNRVDSRLGVGLDRLDLAADV